LLQGINQYLHMATAAVNAPRQYLNVP